MKIYSPKLSVIIGVILILAGLLVSVYDIAEHGYGDPQSARLAIAGMTHKPPKNLGYSVWVTGPIEVAKVFGRSRGCQQADVELISMIVHKSIENNIDPQLVASTIDQESQCDPLAVSSKGAIGLMQIMPKLHKEFNFSEKNLFNESDNIDVGTKILSDLVKQFGEVEAVRRYQGLGPAGNPNYAWQVLNLKEGKSIK